MSNQLIPNDQFQTVVPTENGLESVQSLNTNSPSNNDLLETYDINVVSLSTEIVHEELTSDNELIPQGETIEDIPTLIYSNNSCFTNLNSEALITSLDELYKYLCEVLIRFDSSPPYYQKEDYEVLIKTITNSLIYLYTRDKEIGQLEKIVRYVGIALLGTNPFTEAIDNGYILPGIYLAEAAGEYIEFGVSVTPEELNNSIVILTPIIIDGNYSNYDKQIYNINLVESDPLSLHLDQSTQQDTIGSPKWEAYDLDLGGTLPRLSGRLRWNAEKGTVAMGIGFDGVEADLTMENYYPPVLNKTTANMINGTIVMVDPVKIMYGQRLSIVKAIANGIFPAKLVLGMLTMDVAKNQLGITTWQGEVHDLNITDLENAGLKDPNEDWTEGIQLFLSHVLPGGLTMYEPEAPNLKMAIAVTQRIDGHNLDLYVRVTHGFSLRELHDVQITNVQDGDAPVWSTNRWENKQVVVLNENGEIPNNLVDLTIQEDLSDLVDGENITFTTSHNYKPGSLMIFLNGIKESNFIESTENTFTLIDPPSNIGFTDKIEVYYKKLNY